VSGIYSRARALAGLLILLLTIVGCEVKNSASTVGNAFEGDSNGSGYGGQPRFLEQVLERMVQSLNNVREGFNTASFGRYSLKTCENLGDPVLCERLISPTDAQRKYALDLLARYIDNIRGLSERASIAMVSHELFQNGPRNIKIPVTALAQLGGTKIIINTDAFRAESSAAQVATLAHEFFHLASKDLNDFAPQGGWKDGRTLLDYLGAATAAHYVDNLGKVVVTFPTVAMGCYVPGVRNTLSMAPYFEPPLPEELSANPNAGGQISDAAATFMSSQIDEGDFTVGAWVKVDGENIEERDQNSNGEVIVSNLDQGKMSLQVRGFAMFRYSNGNFAAYSGTYELLDSGLSLPADGNFHYVAVRKNKAAGKLSLFLDGKAGNEYSDKYVEEDGTENPSSVASTGSPFAIGRAGLRTVGCIVNGTNTPLSTIWTCLKPIRGNVASVAIYKEALSLEQLKKLYTCGLPVRRTN